MTISDEYDTLRKLAREDIAAGYTVTRIDTKTLLALLDRRTMPTWEEAIKAGVPFMMADAYRESGGDFTHAMRAFYNWAETPAEPRKVEAWAVVTKCGNRFLYAHRRLAEMAAENAINPRIVHLREVEADHD